MTKWLILSYFANVDALAPSHHIDDRLPFLKAKNIDFHLVSSPCGAAHKGVAHRRIPSPAPSGIRYELRYFLRRKTSKRLWFKFCETFLLLPVYPFYFLEKLLLRLDSTWSWFITASFHAVIYALKHKPAFIYSTGGPVSAHLAAVITSSLAKIPCIVELQDPLVHRYAAPGKLERFYMNKVEGLIFGHAKTVVFLTEQAARKANERNGNSTKASAIYAGATAAEGTGAYKRNDTFTIGHFGSLGGSRNLECFFRALIRLFQEYPDLPGRFRLDLFGNNSRNVSEQLAQFPFKEVLRLRGKKPRHEAVGAMVKCDALLMIQNTDDVSFESIPSKLYEYLLAGRPILALVYRNAELQAVLEERGHFVAQADDEAAIKKGLEEYITGWKQNRFRSVASTSPYTVEKAVEKLISLVKDIEDVERR